MECQLSKAKPFFKLSEFSILVFLIDTSITTPKQAPKPQFRYSYNNGKSE